MSAWLCYDDHINLIVNAAQSATASDFQMLVDANIRSLETRYPGRDFLQEWQDDAKAFAFKSEPPTAIVARAFEENADRMTSMATLRASRGESPLTPITSVTLQTQIVKACDCFDYQACEADDYRQTPAAAYVDAVRRAAIAAGGLTEGRLYDQLLWGL